MRKINFNVNSAWGAFYEDKQKLIPENQSSIWK